MIHGDLKGVCFDRWGCSLSAILILSVKSNILIDQTGHARLADFGLLTIISDPTNLVSSSSCAHGGTARWMSPELIAPERFGFETSRPSKSSDCYALGMVIYETISGNVPFHKHTDLTVFVKVLEGERPSREAECADSLWEILERCWTPQPGSRPNIQDVLRCLERVSQSHEPPIETEWVDEASNSDSSDASGMSPRFTSPWPSVVSGRSICVPLFPLSRLPTSVCPRGPLRSVS